MGDGVAEAGRHPRTVEQGAGRVEDVDPGSAGAKCDAERAVAISPATAVPWPTLPTLAPLQMVGPITTWSVAS